jgi:hypothetical protein
MVCLQGTYNSEMTQPSIWIIHHRMTCKQSFINRFRLLSYNR